MIELLKNWYDRHFSNPQVVILALLLIVGFAIVILYGNMLLPLLASIVIAYLLEASVAQLQKRGVSRSVAAISVFSVFFVLLCVSIVGLIPLLSEQVVQFMETLPAMLTRAQKMLMQLPELYPTVITREQIKDLMLKLGTELGSYSQNVLTFSLSSIKVLLTWAVYLILILLLVFFFMKDKEKIAAWMSQYLSKDRGLVSQVWKEMDQQIGNYVRGKIIEILVVGIASYVVFALMGLQYSLLLGVLVGLSVLVPYVGATVVTVPVALTAFFQWGWSSEFAYLMLGYGIIQALDGNVLVPLIFSEAVNLHPVAIIVAILVFGGLWGFWGVFFAIPLATLVKAVLNAWPKLDDLQQNSESKG